MRRRWRFRPAPLLSASLLLTLACSHSEPFAPPDNSSSEPFAAGDPLRLTYGGGTRPAWLDDDRIIYSFRSAEHSNGRSSTPDQCLGILPATGGRRLRSICNTSAFEGDTLDVQTEPAPEPGTDRLAFLRGRLSVGVGAGLTNFVVGPIDAAPDGTVLQSAAFSTGDGFMMESGLLRWLAPDTLIFLGADDGQFTPCDTCDPIVIRRWRDAFRLPASGGATATLMPGTRFATSMTAGPFPGQAYVTYANDTRLQLLDLATGAASTLVDFGATLPPRDADVAAGRIVLVAGGRLSRLVDDGGAPLQGNDEGGELQLVDPGSGTIIALHSSTLLFRRPRLSPDGRAIIAEGYQFHEVTLGTMNAIVDTVVNPAADIYRIDVP
jgi:hypothetical protein